MNQDSPCLCFESARRSVLLLAMLCAAGASIWVRDDRKTITFGELASAYAGHATEPVAGSQLRTLCGSRVSLVGFIMPLDSTASATTEMFTLRERPEMDPKDPGFPTEEVLVTMRSGSALTYTLKRVEARGMLNLCTFPDADGQPITGFCLLDADAAEFRPYP